MLLRVLPVCDSGFLRGRPRGLPVDMRRDCGFGGLGCAELLSEDLRGRPGPLLGGDGPGTGIVAGEGWAGIEEDVAAGGSVAILVAPGSTASRLTHLRVPVSKYHGVLTGWIALSA